MNSESRLSLTSCEFGGLRRQEACYPGSQCRHNAVLHWAGGLFLFQLGRKCLRDDLSIAHHEGISGERGIVKRRTSRPEDVRHFAFNDLLRKVKRDRVGWEHIRKNLLEHGPYLRMAFQWAVWRNERRIGSIVRHDRLDITGLESLPVMEQRLFRLFIVG